MLARTGFSFLTARIGNAVSKLREADLTSMIAEQQDNWYTLMSPL